MRIFEILAATSLAVAPIAPALAQDASEPPAPGQDSAEQKPESPVTPPPVLVLMSHPDDEITIAPILSRLARDGGTVTIAFATSGDAGPGVTDMEPGAALAELRENEARCAAFALGLPEPQFWRMGDGTLGNTPRAEGSPARELIGLVREVIAQTKPRVIMTWGPDGGYGHGDHRMLSAAVTQVVQGMGDDRPDLLYSAIPPGPQAELPEFEQWATTHPSLITDRIRYQPRDLNAARSALACYESQFSPEVRAGLIDLLGSAVWRGTIHFRLAFPPRM